MSGSAHRGSQATKLSAYLNDRKIPGAAFMPIFYVPAGEEHYPYRGERCEGVEVIVNDRNTLDAPELGIEAVSAIWKLYPDKFQIDRVDRLLAEQAVFDQIKAGTDPARSQPAGRRTWMLTSPAVELYLLYK